MTLFYKKYLKKTCFENKHVVFMGISYLNYKIN